jgi:exonuclease III
VWDAKMREYLNDLQTKKPVVWTGDLNVCHLDGDVWNPDAKHIPTQVEILNPKP